MCVRVCLYAEPVSRSNYYAPSWMNIVSVVCLYTPVSPSLRRIEVSFQPWCNPYLLTGWTNCPVLNNSWYRRMPVHTCVGECAWNGGYIWHWGHPFLRTHPWWSLYALPGGVTVGDSGLCCCVPCLSSAIISPCLLILHKRSRPHSLSDYNI